MRTGPAQVKSKNFSVHLPFLPGPGRKLVLMTVYSCWSCGGQDDDLHWQNTWTWNPLFWYILLNSIKILSILLQGRSWLLNPILETFADFSLGKITSTMNYITKLSSTHLKNYIIRNIIGSDLIIDCHIGINTPKMQLSPRSTNP